MNKKLIGGTILVGVGLFVYSLYSYAKRQASLLEQFTYKISGLKIDTINLQTIKGSISVLFSSLSDVEVIVEKFYLDFYFNGERLGYLEDETAFVIPARGTTNIPFMYTLNPQLIFGNVTDILAYTLRQKDAAISVRGYATLKSGFVKATLPLTYDTTIKEILRD
jgi:hypothetical protein